MPGPKVLAQHAGTFLLADVYTVPPGGGAIVSSIVVSGNTLSNFRTFEVRVAPGGAADNKVHVLIPPTTLNVGDRIAFTEGITLAPGDKVRVKAEPNVIVHLYGTEL